MTSADPVPAPLRQSPLHEPLVAVGARWESHAGWERAADFGDPAAEHRAGRDAVALFDRSGAGQLLVQGPDAEVLLSRRCAADVGGPEGSVTRAPLLDRSGRYAGLVTVHRIAASAFLVETGAGLAADGLSLIQDDGDDLLVFVDDVTGGTALIDLVGPRAAALLATVGPNDVSERRLPVGTWRPLEVGHVPVRAARREGPGAPRYTLAMPSDQAAGAWDALCEAGMAIGAIPAGAIAWESLRLEAGRPVFGQDLGPDIGPFEAGQEDALPPLERGADFRGRAALRSVRDAGTARRLVCFRTDRGSAVPAPGAAISRNGQTVGHVTSAAFGHTLGHPVGLALVTHGTVPLDAFLADGGFALTGDGGNVKIDLSPRPFLDATDRAPLS